MDKLVLLIAALAILKKINAEPSGKGALMLWIIVGMSLFFIAVGAALVGVLQGG